MSITALNDYAIGDIDLTAIVETLDKTYKGKADITISAYDTTAAPTIKVGSVFECNGALYIVDTTDITPTGYSGISVSTTFYLYYDESAGAFIYSSTAPTWSDALQGWYNGNDRAFFSMYKDSGGTLYQLKTVLSITNAYSDNFSFTSNTVGQNHILPRGHIIGYVDQSGGTTYHRLQLYVNGSWTEANVGSADTFYVYSDGVAARIYHAAGAASITAYYRVIT